MSKNKTTSLDIKRALLKKYYEKFKYKYVCAEVGEYYADVLVYNDKYLTEFEVKISKSDLINDFNKKKHQLYYELKKSYKQSVGYDEKNKIIYKTRYINNPSRLHIPNYFYFALTKDLCSKALELIENNNDKYGILCYNGKDDFKVIKVAKLLHKESIDKKNLDVIIKRMSSIVASKY